MVSAVHHRGVSGIRLESADDRFVVGCACRTVTMMEGLRSEPQQQAGELQRVLGDGGGYHADVSRPRRRRLVELWVTPA